MVCHVLNAWKCYHKFFNYFNTEHDCGDSDDDFVVNSDDYSNCIKILNSLMSGGK